MIKPAHLLAFVLVFQLCLLMVIIFLIAQSPVHRKESQNALPVKHVVERAFVDLTPGHPASARAHSFNAATADMFSAVSRLASGAGLKLTKVKMTQSTESQSVTLVFNMVTTYMQYKQFLSRLLEAEPRLVLQKSMAQRLLVPATAVSFEVTMVLMPPS